MLLINAKNLNILGYLLTLLASLTRAATHWIVTEDGKIHTQEDSIFTLRRPYDLVALLQQENRAQMLKQIKGQLMVQKEEIESGSSLGSATLNLDGISVDNDVDDVEQFIYTQTEDCHKAGKFLTDFDLYVGTVLFLGPEYGPGMKENDNRKSGDEFVKKFVELKKEYDIPNCTEIYPFHFSMHSYEHLNSIQNRDNLAIDPEPDLHLTITTIDDLSSYGHAVNQAMKQNTSSWVSYTMASYYWRAKGQAKEAVECLRRALFFSPQRFKYIPLTSLGNVLHRSHQSEEAAVVVHHAIDVSQDNPSSHFTLGNIYAVLADYNKSLICYDNVLKLNPSFDEAKRRYHAVLCHQKVEKALKAQHDSLQKTLEELQGYQKQQEVWLQYQQKLLSEQAPPGVLLEQRLQYREHKIREIIDSNVNSGLGMGSMSGNSMANSMKKVNTVTANGGPASGSGSSSGSMNQGENVSGGPPPPPQAACAAAAMAAQKGGKSVTGSGSGTGHTDCHVVPILIPITFVPPS